MTTTINASTSSGLVQTADTSGILQLQTANTAAMTIDASQNVGVGTASPAAKLDVNGNVFVRSSNNLYTNGIYGYDSNVNISTNSSGSQVIKFSAGAGAGTELMRITSAGNVGIGTNSPTAPLSIASGLSYTGMTLEVTAASAPNNRKWLMQADTLGNNTPAVLAFYDLTGSNYCATLNPNGNLALLGGTRTANGTGITFPATQSASSDANCLDDYEEGTWTPTIIGTSTAGTASYSAQTGKYTKIGNLCYVTFYVDYSSGNGTGNLRISGLPFTGASGVYQGLAISGMSNITNTSGSVPFARINSGESQIAIKQFTTGTIQDGDIPYDGSGAILFSGCYIVA